MSLEKKMEKVNLEAHRPDWDTYFAIQTYLVSTRGACLRRKNGAIIVNDEKEIIASGYNSAPRKLKNCLEIGTCLREERQIPSGQNYEVCRSKHAEDNALSQLARGHGGSIGAKMYITRYPCGMCAKDIVHAGITEIIFLGGREFEESKNILKEGGVKVRKFPLPIAKIIEYLNTNQKHYWKDIV